MYSFVCFSFFVLSISASSVVSDCTPRMAAANVTLKDLEGVWYIMVFVNESDVQERRSCIKVTYSDNPENGTWREGRSSIPVGSRNVLEEHVYITMTDGVTNGSAIIDGTVTTVHEVVTNIEKEEYLIIAVCKKENGTKVDDRLALYTRDRNMPVSRMRQLLCSMRLKGDANTYYYIHQKNCPN